MDIFKQKRYLIFVIFLLVIMNISTLIMLWIDRPSRRVHVQQPPHPEQERLRLQGLLKRELGFNNLQIRQYLRLRHEHRERIHQLETEKQQIKRLMFDEVLGENPRPTLSDSLLKLAQEKQAHIEQLTFQHFLDLKKLCKPEQQNKLKVLMHELFRRQHPEDSGRPPRPPQHEPPFQNE